jgi:predicted TIM-barrel fold metal-dependent hydrolase
MVDFSTRTDAWEDAEVGEQPYLVVSCDSHAGPSLTNTLRAYCPSEHLADFDAYAAQQREILGRQVYFGDDEKHASTLSCRGHDDPRARLRDMDESGVAAQVIFGGGQNWQAVPFLGTGFAGGSTATSAELRFVGERIWNDWLSDFVAESPARLVGVMQAPLWDVEQAAPTIEHFADRGLKALNFPSPRADFPAYNDPAYEPIWRICEERRLPLVVHSGAGEGFLGANGPGGPAIVISEFQWLSRRHLPQLIFGGVFERHPALKVVFTEQRVAWAIETLRDYDSLYYSDLYDASWRAPWPRLPSEYWKEHCYIAGSFLAAFEAELRYEVGLENLLWGDDYPHVEGTWPMTLLNLRDTFAAVPERDTRMILGENAITVYDLDRAALDDVARRIGPLPSQVAVPVDASEIPEHPASTFRRRGSWS